MKHGNAWSTLRSSPATMFFGILFGVAFALGHHFFYNSLNNKNTPNADYDILGTAYHVSGQQINVSAGTILAFFSKFCLGFAVSNAFEQVAWKAVKEKTRVGTIDDLFNVLNNGFQCFNFTLWRRFPLAMVLALIFWLLPVASFVTPATLTVHLLSSAHSHLRHVPQVDFTSLNFAFLPVADGLSASFTYLGPQDPVQRVVTSTITEGNTLQIDSTNANASWALNFNGPALKCTPVNSSFHDEVKKNVFAAMNQTDPPCAVSYGYISWIPDTSTSNGSLPFTELTAGANYTLRPGTIGPVGDNFRVSGGVLYPTDFPPLSIMVAAFPKMSTEFLNTGCYGARSWLNYSTILQCDMFNTTYAANFTYQNGAQNVNVSLPQDELNAVGFIAGANGDDPLGEAYANGTMIQINGTDVYNATYVEMFAYESIMDALGRVLVGTVANTLNAGGVYVSSLVSTNTTILSTSLARTDELFFLNGATGATDTMNLGNFFDGHSKTHGVNSTMPLQQALEESFRNITISLMNEASLQPNYSSPYAPSKVNVTVESVQDVYYYSSQMLWIAYAVAIILSLGCTLVGLLAFQANNHSTYETKFSTILRTTHEAMFGRGTNLVIREEDRDGKNPLPPYIANAEISMQYSRGKSKSHDPEFDGMELDQPRTGALWNQKGNSSYSQLIHPPDE